MNIQKDVLLANCTTFKIGGPAKFFCQVEDEKELEEALEYARENNLKFFILGGGSNILASDDGFKGLVVKIKDFSFSDERTKLKIQNYSLNCGAGMPLAQAVGLAKENGLTGLEWAAGIPGTVGGAVRGNAGAYGFDMGGIVESVKIFYHSDKEKNLKVLNKEDCDFSYRNSIFKKDGKMIILSCILRLQKGDKTEIERKIEEIVKKRAEKMPKEPSAGSVFKNPVVKDKKIIEFFLKDGGKMDGDKIPAGWLIEEVGLKGKKIGGASVSEEHANVIINRGNATAQDVISLIGVIKMKVRNEFGLELKEEVQYVGF